MENHPRIVEIGKEEAGALKRAASANMAASAAAERLKEAERLESDFLAEREGRAIAMVDSVVLRSEEVLKTADQNYRDLDALSGSVESFADRSMDLLGRIKAVFERFELKSAKWEADMKAREERVADMELKQRAQKATLDGRRKANEAREKELVALEERIRSREQELGITSDSK